MTGNEAGLDVCHRSLRDRGRRTVACLLQSREQRCETRTLQGEKAGYLSKFSSGLFFLHSSMCNQVVEHLSCKKKKKERRRENKSHGDVGEKSKRQMQRRQKQKLNHNL